MAKVDLYKPGYNPYNFKDALGTQLVEFTNEYMMAKVINAGHWHTTGAAQIANDIPIPYDKLLKKCDGKIYIDYEMNGNISGTCWTSLHFNNSTIITNTNLRRNIYVYNILNKDTTITFSAGHNCDSGAYIKCYSIYIEVPIKLSENIKNLAKSIILNNKLFQEYVTICQGEES